MSRSLGERLSRFFVASMPGSRPDARRPRSARRADLESLENRGLLASSGSTSSPGHSPRIP